MLSKEENEALEILKSFEPDDLFECAIYLQALEKITNLIEKQSKEIEELYEIKYLASRFIHRDIKQFSIGEFKYKVKNYIMLQDRIKAKIELLEKLQKEFPNNDEIRIKIITYKELLEKE